MHVRTHRFVHIGVVAALATLAHGAQEYVFTEDFESPTWADDVGTAGEVGKTWTREGVGQTQVKVVQFADGDCRLNGATIGSQAGGFTHSKDGGAGDPCAQVPGDGQPNMGDNEENYLDFHMTGLPNGEYSFHVEVDQLIYWAEATSPSKNQSWSQGELFYLGDAPALAYGTQLPHQAPTGTWKGYSWNTTTRENQVRISPMIWNSGFDDNDDGYCGNGQVPATCGNCSTPGFNNGTTVACSSRNSGVWIHHEWNKFRNNEEKLIVTDGEAILRMAIRNKRNDSKRTAHAMDNLVVTLISSCNDPFADADGDGDVDQEDFAVFQRCITGADDPSGAFDPEICQCFNRDGGDPEDIDEIDLAAFRACGSGPDVPADPDCDNN